MKKADIGLIGLAVMGQNLVLNMESHGYTVAVYNRSPERTDHFMATTAKGKNIIPAHELESFIAALDKPRKVMIMVQAGKAVDAVIEQLLTFLEPGDVVIDGGNSFFKDTIRRSQYLEEKGIHFLGAGVSGGEEGALKGPSIMPGGSKEAWALAGKILVDISAKVAGGTPCCGYIGENGSGHYVKVTHNGIEYGDMQLICEAYFLLKELLGMSYPEMQKTFAEWNKGDLDSYLIEITADILSKTDSETGKPMAEIILDRAGQKGTGKWTSQEALDLGVAAPTIAEAVFARCLSAQKDARVAASKAIRGSALQFEGDKASFVEDIRLALYASKICSYAQGFDLLKEASKAYGWSLNMGEIALMWRGGCIIRARFLERIKEAYDRNPNLENLMMDPYFEDILFKAQAGWRRVVAQAALMGIPAPSFASALSYFDGYRRESLPANLLQAQRDYFGAHTYERTDKPGSFHTEWLNI